MDFIAVAEDTLGAKYNDGDKEQWKKIVEEYQAKVNELAANLSAGSSSYLYLPSAESLFAESGTAFVLVFEHGPDFACGELFHFPVVVKVVHIIARLIGGVNYLEPDKDKYYPADEIANTVFADEHLKADMAVKVYFTLTDITSSSVEL